MNINSIEKVEVKIIHYKGQDIIFLNNNINKSKYDKTQQLNKVIMYYTNVNVIDVEIYKKEKIQIENQDALINLTEENNIIKETKIPNKKRIIQDLEIDLNNLNDSSLIQQKETKIQDINYEICILDETFNKNLKEILKRTEIINKYQLKQYELDKQYVIKENVLKEFDIDNSFIKSINENKDLVKILFDLNLIKVNKKGQNRFRCLCSESNCGDLFLIRHKETNIYFAVGSDCINRIHPELKKQLDLCIYEEKLAKCIKCNCSLYTKQYKICECLTTEQNYDPLFRGNCYNCYKEFLVNSNNIIMKLNDMEADKRIHYLKKKIIEENKLIEERKIKRCKDCDIIVMETRKFITKCTK